MIKRSSAFSKRLQSANKAYEATHFNLHHDYRRKYAETLREQGIPNEGGLVAHLSLPCEFHDSMKEAQQTLISGLELAKEARRASIGRAPRSKIIKTFVN
jgi:hypothetical protein